MLKCEVDREKGQAVKEQKRDPCMSLLTSMQARKIRSVQTDKWTAPYTVNTVVFNDRYGKSKDRSFQGQSNNPFLA